MKILILALVLCGCHKQPDAVEIPSTPVRDVRWKQHKASVNWGIGIQESRIPSHLVSGTVRNNASRTMHNLEIKFDIYDRTGAKIGSRVDSLSDLKSGESWRFKVIAPWESFPKLDGVFCDGDKVN